MKDQPLELYKAFVDDLVERSPGPYARWIMEKGWPETEENARVNKVLQELTLEQKEVFALVAQSSRDGGIHDVLVYLSEQINLNGMDISFGGVAMAKEPFDTELYYDWVCRREGDVWPDPE